MKRVFTEIYRTNVWASLETRCGSGSELRSTEQIRAQLPGFLRKYKVKTLLDAPCGDWNWMKSVNLPVKKYIGIDIVDELVESCRKYQDRKHKFMVLDIAVDDLPRSDLILAKDVLFHFSQVDGLRALRNFKRSKSKYLLTTTYPRLEYNRDIVTGEWTRINLSIEPYNLGLGIDSIPTGIDDNELMLWRLKDILNR